MHAREKGDRLERAAARYLADQQEVQFVRPWQNWAYEKGVGLNDIGVDLVAIRDGAPWAVQCKHWESKVSWNDLGSFIGALNDARLGFAGGYLIADRISRTAAAKLANSPKPIVVILADDLKDYLEAGEEDRQQATAPHALRPYQAEAVQRVRDGLAQHKRGKLVMAPGTGKTTVAAHVAGRMDKGSLILFCCPAIALLDQSIRAFRRDCPDLHACAVVSDAAVGRDDDDLAALAFPATTDAAALKQFSARRDKVNVVFATYQSMGVVVEAQRMGFPAFDLAICDEAHHTAGVSTTGDDAFRLIHDDANVRAAQRLYMTATPRVFDVREEQRKVLDANPAVRLYDMSDESVYGPTLYEYGMRRAINDGYLSPYRLVVIALDKAAVQEELRDYLAGEGAHSVDETTKLIGLAHLVNGQLTDERGAPVVARARRGIVFVNRVSRAQKVAEDFGQIYRAAIAAQGQPEVRHIEGKMSAWQKRKLIQWLGEPGDQTRVLANAKVLGEGIDVPALDFVAFLDPRESVIEVIQAVGRVVRRAEGKTHGLIFVPLVISGDRPNLDEVFEGGPYKTLWRVLSALAAVDDGFLARLRLRLQQDAARHSAGDEDDLVVVAPPSVQAELFQQIREHLKLKIVRSLRLGREFLLDWAKETADLARTLKDEVGAAARSDAEMQRAFAELRAALRAFLQDDVSEMDVAELIVQYVLIHPIFEAIFERRSAIDDILHQIFGRFKAFVDNNAPSLPAFYARARERAAGLRDEAERQEFLRQLYSHFLSVAFPETAEALGIAFTPLPLVEFTVRFADHLTRKHFGRALDDEGVVILDPFAGVGTFIAMAVAGMRPHELRGKLAGKEIWANEILLLPYMAASKNVESTIVRATGDAQASFDAALWSDSFRMMEHYYGGAQPQLPDVVPPLYREHIAAQLSAKVNVILTNPPWRGGRKSENEANPNAIYPHLRQRIAETYARSAPYMPRLLSALYNTSIQALRMASDRIREGVIGFVMDNGWVKSSSGRGVRRALREEFDEIYVYDLRGDARTSGEARRCEGDNVFGEQSRSGVCILLAVRHAGDGPHQGRIHYRAVPDYADLETKFAQLRADAETPDRIPWQTLTPDRQHDWLAQGREGYETLVGLDEIFGLETYGLKSHRDRYIWNFDADELGAHMQRLIEAYNNHVARLPGMEGDLEGWIERDPRAIKWDRSLKKKLMQKVRGKFDAGRIYPGLYRPFVPMCAYFDPLFNAQVGELAQVFPGAQAHTRCIVVSGPSTKGGFSALCCDRLPDYGLLGSALVYPLHVHPQQGGLLPSAPEINIAQDAVARFRAALGDSGIGAEDLFYYAFGVLSTPRYREAYANDLARSAPRIPVCRAFWAIAQAGRALADLQLGFDSLEPFALKLDGDAGAPLEKARFDRAASTVLINGRYALAGFPPEAMGYRVGAYHPVEWLTRYLPPSHDEETGITWDPGLTVGGFAGRVGQAVAMSLRAVQVLESLDQAVGNDL